jgi:hypothetical protein
MAKKKTTKGVPKRTKAAPERKRSSSPSRRAAEDASTRILNCLPSPEQHEDWDMGNALSAGLTSAVGIPPSKDLRETWWKIGDQGSTGSCVGWATADSVLRWHFTKAGRLDEDQLLSTRFTWMASKETDEFAHRPTTFIEADGTSLKAALDVSRKFGAVRDSVLPFGSGQLYQGDAKTFYVLASQLRIDSYINLGRNLQDWRQWIAKNGPILTRLNVDQTWMDAQATQGKLETYRPATTLGGHAVALVGYTPSTFIVRNSWGTETWGDEGFAYASDAYAADAFTEAYGVSVS